MEEIINATCPSCRRPAGPDDRFCGACGASLRPTCGNCGRGYEPGTFFCTNCGAPLSRQEDRRRVSVLFIDVVAFTAYAERTDPEQVRLLQNDYFETVRRVVRQHGGVVEKYIGDAAMALFGAPVSTENDPLRCVSAALELARILPRQDRVASASLRFRMGVATGEALVDVSAARDGGQAIVAGDVVNLAARLQGVARPGDTLVCENTYEATRGAIEYAEQPAVTARGRSRPSRVWVAVAARRSRPDDWESEPIPMVDREHERGLLINALHRTVRNRVPQLVTIFGAAGIGKSRLLRELSRHAATLGDPPVRWRVGHCPPFGENVTYAALADIVKAEAAILDSDDDATVRSRLREALAGLVPEDDVAPLAGALGPLVGLPGEIRSAGEAEQAWRRFILAMAARDPTVLVFEDLHWADEPMLRFVEMLGASARGLPLLLLCTARPELRERHPEWTSTITGTVSVSLPPMRDADIGTLYSLMFGQAVATPDELIELADGNPLYAQEYVRMLLDGGLLRVSGPRWTFPAGDTPPMPDNVQAVIANRLDLLDPADRAALQAAAVVGRQFWPGAVAAAVGQTEDAVLRALSRLEQRDLVQEQLTSTMAGQREYRFRHILVRDVCYQRLPRSERVARHQRTADWLESVADGRAADLAEVLANHRWAAHEITRTLGLDPAPYAPAAREAMHRAGRRAFALHALDTAAEWVDRARGLRLPADPRLDLFAAELNFYRDRDAFLAGGGMDRLADLAGRLDGAGAAADAAAAWTLLGTAAWSRADRPATLRHLGRAVSLYRDLPDSPEKAYALLELARVHMLNCENPPAIATADAAAVIADRLGLVEATANARVTRATARYMAGDPEGLADLIEITDLCRRQQVESRRRAIQNLAWATLEEGDVAAANRLVDEQHSIDLAGGHGLATSFAEEAMRAYLAGDWDASIESAIASMQRPTAEWDLHVVAQAAWLRALRAEPDADRDVDGAVTAARRSGFHRVLLSTCAHAMLCRAVQGRRDDALELLAVMEDDWAGTSMLAYAEWVAAAANAGALLGRVAAIRVRAMLKGSPRRTPWISAAMATLEGALTGDPDAHLEAAEGYRRIGNVSDQMLALSHALRSVPAGAGAGLFRGYAAQLAEFVRSNRAPGLAAGLPVEVPRET